jgi:hypothetical protein
MLAPSTIWFLWKALNECGGKHSLYRTFFSPNLLANFHFHLHDRFWKELQNQYKTLFFGASERAAGAALTAKYSNR